MEKRILKILKSNNAPVHARYLYKTLGIAERTLRTHIKSLRRQGYLILSNTKGYRLVKDVKEFNHLEKFAKSILKTIGDMKKNNVKRLMPRLIS